MPDVGISRYNSIPASHFGGCYQEIATPLKGLAMTWKFGAFCIVNFTFLCYNGKKCFGGFYENLCDLLRSRI